MKTRTVQSFLWLVARLALVIVLVAAGAWTTARAASPALVIPTISILSVTTDASVTIRTANYPANDTYNVYMGKFGTRGVGGVKVDTISSGSGGSFDKTFNIPAELKGQQLIAIRLESPTSGYYSYNWFTNKTDGVIPDTGGSLPPGVIPTFDVTAVDPDKTITVKTNNFPKNDSFTVTMGKFGTRGVGGIVVDTVASGEGGSLTKTFNIPAELKGLAQIAVRFESKTSGYYSYNWFNNKSGGSIPVTGGLSPSFSITKVAADNSVTIQTANLPANDTFNVYMNVIGTRGVGGTLVQSVSSGTGGTQTFTFNIPAGLKGLSQISIRLESPTSGYYAYNWFWNNTYP